MVTLTQEQIDSLGLSPDVINELATANPLTKKKKIAYEKNNF